MRRHRVVALALAVIAAGVFMVFVTRVHLQEAQAPPLRVCTFTPLLAEYNFEQKRREYHGAIDRLVRERMDLYEGWEPLACEGETLDTIIPPGTWAERATGRLDTTPNAPEFSYGDFLPLLYEMWRTYDCELFALQQDVLALAKAFEANKEERISMISFWREQVQKERDRSARAFERLMWALRTSEQQLPLHAALRCLQRAGEDVRNAAALLSDASQCLPARLVEPHSSLLVP